MCIRKINDRRIACAPKRKTADAFAVMIQFRTGTSQNKMVFNIFNFYAEPFSDRKVNCFRFILKVHL